MTAANKAAHGHMSAPGSMFVMRWGVAQTASPSMVRQTSLGAAQAVSSFAFGAWFCRDAPAAPYFAGALFPARRFRLVLGKPLWWRRPCGRRCFKSPGGSAWVRGSALLSGCGAPSPLGFGPLALAFPPGSPLCSVVGGPARGVSPRAGGVVVSPARSSVPSPAASAARFRLPPPPALRPAAAAPPLGWSRARSSFRLCRRYFPRVWLLWWSLLRLRLCRCCKLR